MRTMAEKSAGCAVSGEESGLLSGADEAGAGNCGRDTPEELRQLARRVYAEIAELDPSHSKELLGVFVSELFLSVAEQERRAIRRQQQAEGIAAARERGVQFGRTRKPLPENFEACHVAWRGGRMSLREAAKACGMSHSSFRSAAVRLECAG